MLLKRTLLPILFLVTFIPAHAIELAPKETQLKIQKSLEGIIENSHLVRVYFSDLPNYYILQIGGQTAMISQDGQYLIDGDVIDLKSRKSLLKDIHTLYINEQVNAIKSDEKVTFKAENEIAAIHVFSDIDCGYCRKLHREVADLNKEGITVHYLAFPRTGPNTKSWTKSENVWCAQDKQKSMNLAKRGKSTNTFPQVANCPANTTVTAQYELGQKIGVRGTPSIIMPNGELVPGYLPHTQLIAKILSSPPK